MSSPAHTAPRRVRTAALAAVVLAAAIAVVVATTGTEPAAAGPPPVVQGYVPLPTDDFQGYLEGVNSAADSTIAFTVGITNAAAGATIYYDHHEDGFEADIANPSQSTTLVLGDGNAGNGNAGTYCSACIGDLLPQGAPLIMRSSIPTPRNTANRFFDGGDKVASTRGITITAGGYSTPLSSVLSGVVSAYDTSKWGIEYTVPVGEDTPFPATTTDAFSYTGASIMASTAGTVVDVDEDGDGDVDETQTVAEGRTLFVDGGLSEGATIRSSAPVQVHLLTGRRLSDYEARSFTLYPDDVLSNDYMSPAGSNRTNFRTVNYLFNPGAAPITVTPQCTGCSGTLSVPAGASTAFHSPTGQAVRFSTTGARFIAIAGVGAQSGAAPGGGANEARMYDWGFTMLPTSQLTTQVALGWAPGNSNIPPTTAGTEESYDPVWVTTLTGTTVHVDYDGSPTTGSITTADCFGARHDVDIPVTALASTRIFDPDGDMTGARIYTCDGTKIAGAWGQDPSTASQTAPGFDAGYTIIPTSSMIVEKTARVATDVDGDGGFGPGDTMTYEIAIADAGSLAFTDVRAEDVLPPGLAYVPESTRLVAGSTTTPYADDGPSAATPFPLDEGGIGLPDIAAGQTVYLRFEVDIVEPWVDDTATIGNTACVRAAEATSCDTSSTALTTADVSLTKTEQYGPQFVGDVAMYQIAVTNDGPDSAPGLEVTDVLPPGLALDSQWTDQGSYDGDTGVWSVGELAVGQTRYLHIGAITETDGVLLNQAYVSGGAFVDPDSTPGVPDPDDPEDDEDEVTVEPAPLIDLELEAEVTSPPDRDGHVEVTVSLTNRSLTEATGVGIGHGHGHTLLSAVPSTGTFDGSWEAGTIAPGATETLVLTYDIDLYPFTYETQITSADQPDIDSEPSNMAGTVAEDDEILLPIDSDWTDLRVSKLLVDEGWAVGDEVEFWVMVDNEGEAPATGVEVTEQLPAGLTLIEATPDRGTFDPATDVWSVGTIAPGSTAGLTVRAEITGTGPQVNRAQVTALDQQDVDSTPDLTVDGEDDEAEAGIDVEGQGRIGDRVWDDLDGDGTQDPGEPGLENRPVGLNRDQDGDGTFETPWGFATTDADGAYLFEDLDDERYEVVTGADEGDGRVPTTPVSVIVDLGLDEVRSDVDFGFSDAADLAVTKSVVSVGPSVGDEVTYLVTVANDGPAGATGVVVEDALPPGLADATASLGTYDAGTGLWAVGSLADGASATLEITATITASTAIRNTATVVESDQPDPDPDDDTASADIDVDPEIDLSLTKGLAGAAPTHVGDEVTFAVTVANAGPSGATGVEVTDVLPAGLADVTVDAGVGSYDEATGVWAVGDLAAGDDATLEITATVTATTLTNTAEITAAGEPDVDSTPGNGATDPAEDDRDTATVEVDPLVDVSVAKTGTSPSAVGEVASFEVEVTNAGPSTATGVEITDALPPGLTFVSGTPSVGTYSAGIWTVGSLADDQVATLAITAILEEPGPVTNVATLTGLVEDDRDDADDEASAEVGAPGASIGDRVWDDLDGDGTQDSGEPGLEDVTVTLLRDGSSVATDVTDADGAYVFDGLAPGEHQVVADAGTAPVGHVPTTPTQVEVTLTPGQVVTTADIGFSGAADLVLTKTVTGPPTFVGDTATFRVTVSNRGPATATGVVVSDPQPAGLLLQDATASQGALDEATGEWSVGDLADGESATLDLAYRVDVSTEITNVAEIVTSDQPDPDPDDDTASASVDVDALVDLSVTKEEVGDPTYLGQRAVFEVTVANAGPSTATAVAITDLLPPGLTFLSADPEVGSYDEITGLWAVGELAAGDDATLEVRAQVDALSTTNTAEVSGAAEADIDSTPGNGPTTPAEDDRASVDVTVLPRSDLALTKTGSAPEFVGQNATFELEVANTGPSLATGVEVTDLLPAGLVFVSATATSGVYDAVTGVWTIGALPVDSSETLTITARLDVLGPVANTAEVTAVDQADPDSTPDNSAPAEDDRASASVGAGGGSIGDRVWDDRDADGTQDSGEPGLDGVTVTLLRDGSSVATDVTDADGTYGFGDLEPGAYRVVVMGTGAPAGHIPTTPTTIDIALAPGDAVDDADVGFSGAVDLRVDKTLSETPSSVGDAAAFEIVVSNDGPAAATGVVVADELPTALAYVSSSASVGSYDEGTGLWTVGDLAAGSSATLTIEVVVDDTTAVNTAEVAAVDQDDPTSTPGNADDEPDEDDTDAATIDVDALVDLSLAKEVTGEPTHIGDEATFEITVANAGPSPATGVTVDDALPDGLTFVSASASTGSYDESTGVWTVGSVAADAEATLEIVATVDVLSVTNTAEVTAAAEADADSEPGNRDTDPGEDDGASVDVTVAPLVDLSLAKTETTDPSHLGDIATFVLTAANSGPSTATGVVVADELPAGLAFVSASTTSGTYDAGTGLWSIPSIAAGGSATLTLAAAVTDLTVTNRAEIVAAAEDDADSQPAENPLGASNPPDQDDEDDALVTVDALVDVSVVKVETANPTVVGDEAVFEVTVANGGPVTATDVAVTDQLPAGLTYVSADAEVGTYDPDTGIWTVGSLAAGTDATLVIRALVADLEVTNVAEVTATTEDDRDSTPANGATDPAEDDRATAEVTVEPLIDLALDKELVSTPTHIGDEAVFTLTVSNAGPSPATSVAVVDQLPTGLTYVSDDAGGAYDPESGEWEVGTVGVLASRTLTITARVDALEVANLAQVVDAAEVDADSQPAEGPLGPDDPPDQDDEDTTAVTVAPRADLSLTKTSSPTTIDQGEDATFTVTVRNDGPSPATDVVVADQLPSGVTYVSHTASTGSWSSSTGEWAVGTVASGSSATLEIVVTVDAAGPVTNIAEVTAVTEADPDSTPGDGVGDDVDSSTVSSEPLIDLGVTKEVSAPTAAVDEDVDFTVTVTNDGPSDATGVAVLDSLPSGLTHVTDSATQGSWTASTGVWDVGSLAVGATATLIVTATVTGVDPVTNVAEVSTADQDDVDSMPGNDSPDEDDRAVATVGGIEVDLSLSIAASDSTVAVGDQVTYTVTVDNDGPSDATGVAVLDALPEGLTYVGATAPVGSFDPASGEWSLGSLGVGDTATLDLVAIVDGAGSITNQAQISAAVEPDVDSSPGNLSGPPAEDDEDEVVVTGQQIDLSLTKTVDVTTPSIGGEATYTLTLANDGPSTATFVRVADGLPAGLRWVDDTSGGTYDPDTGVWTVDSLSAGSSTSITITTEVVGTGSITNEARVIDAAQPDADSTAGNDDPAEDDQDAVTIAPAAASVRGTVWLDADGNGALDAGERTIEGVTVLLVSGSGDLAGSAVTNGDGGYAFTSVAPGGYAIVVDEATLPDTVAGQTYDPDQVADGATEISLAAGEELAGIDFGYEPAPSDALPDAPSPPDELGWSPTDLLARTGVDTWTPVFAGTALLLGGALVVGLVSRRRRTL